jgi:hypothetical protein
MLGGRRTGMSGDLSYYYALWQRGELPSEDVPRIARAALQEGLDSPALRRLAGFDRPTSWEIARTFDDACSQLGIVPAPAAEIDKRKSEAWLRDAVQIAKRISTEILNGTVDPAEGWLRLPYREDELGSLSVFFEFADPLGPVQFDDKFRSRVIEAAKRFQATAV